MEVHELASVVVICRANVARSPLLARRLQREADRRLGAGVVAIASAGTDAVIGASAADGSQKIASTWGLSLSEHRSRPLTHVDLEGAELVVTMSRRQRRIVAGLVSSSNRDRVFALRELVPALELLREEGTLARIDTEHPAPRERLRAVTRAAACRRPRTAFRRSFDVPDPLRGSPALFEKIGAEFAAASESLAEAFFGPAAT